MANEQEQLVDPQQPSPFATAAPGTAFPPQGTSIAPAPGTAPLRFYVAAHTDMGCVRTNNEDAFRYDQQAGIYVVCDGMGGGPSGEVGSATAVETIVNDFAASQGSGVSVRERLHHAVEAANSAVWEIAQSPENKGMGTTAVAVALDGNQAIIANVGDSRAYMLGGGRCVQLTIDHSYRNELIRKGQLSVEDAMSIHLDGMESVICRAIGAASTVEPDFFTAQMDHGAAILLASDGLTRYLLQDEILAVVSQSSFDTACVNLIEQAKQKGGADNITCLLLLSAVTNS